MGLGPEAVESEPSVEGRAELLWQRQVGRRQAVPGRRTSLTDCRHTAVSPGFAVCLVWQQLRVRRPQWGDRAWLIMGHRCHIRKFVL